MAYNFVTESQAREAGKSALIKKSASVELFEAASTVTDEQKFDVFLSHAFRDADVVRGVRNLIRATGLTVYVDWIEDPKLERDKVTPKTANTLRQRMMQCESLIFLYSKNSAQSRWMPWELGFFDGFKGHVAVMPIIRDDGDESFINEEYLGLYPKADIATGTDKKRRVRINKSASGAIAFGKWLQDEPEKFRPAA